MKLSNTISSGLLITSFLSANDFESQFNYFGNLTGSVLNEKGYEVMNVTNSNINDSINLSSYSKIGGQVSLYNEDFTFMAQTLAYKYKEENKLEITWLNGKYQVNDEFAIRAGRMQLGIFLDSNTLDIDYTHLWAKAPVEIYNIMPLKGFDGIELHYDKLVNDYYINLKLTPYGKASKSIKIQSNSLKAKFKNMKAVSLSVEKNNVTLKTSYTTGKYYMPSDYITGLEEIKQTLTQFGNDMSSYSYDYKKIEYLSFGIDYTYDNYSFNSEIVKTRSDSLALDMTAYYLLFSYRYNQITPYIMFSENKNDKDYYNVDNIHIPTNLPENYYKAAIQSKSALESILYNMNCSQKTSTIGFRYDYDVGIAIKTQVDRITFSDYGNNPYSGLGTHSRYGFFTQENGVTKKPVYQLTVGLSFAF